MVVKDWERGELRVTANGYVVSSVGGKNIWELDRIHCCTTLWMYWMPLSLYLKLLILYYVNLTSVKNMGIIILNWDGVWKIYIPYSIYT